MSVHQHVTKVPESDSCTATYDVHGFPMIYSFTSSARPSSGRGIAMQSVLKRPVSVHFSHACFLRGSNAICSHRQIFRGRTRCCQFASVTARLLGGRPTRARFQTGSNREDVSRLVGGPRGNGPTKTKAN